MTIRITVHKGDITIRTYALEMGLSDWKYIAKLLRRASESKSYTVSSRAIAARILKRVQDATKK